MVNQYPSIFEQYQWWQLDLGLQHRWYLGSKSYIQIYGGMLRTIYPTMKVSVSTLDLQEKWGYKLGFEWIYKLADQHSLGLGSNYTYWEFGRSNDVFDPVINDIIHEPASESKMLVLQFTYQYHY